MGLEWRAEADDLRTPSHRAGIRAAVCQALHGNAPGSGVEYGHAFLIVAAAFTVTGTEAPAAERALLARSIAAADAVSRTDKLQ